MSYRDKKILFVLIFFVFNFLFVVSEVYAAKNKPSNSTLVLKARHGGNIVYGSVLNSKENEVKAKLSKKVLAQVKKEGIENISIIITELVEKKGEKSNIYTLKPVDSVDLFGKTLVINLLNSLKDIAGSTYTAGALKEGTYELALTAGNLTIKGNFVYKPPVVTVGNVITRGGECGSGVHQINDLTGKKISEVVALSKCSYFNEVQANRINDKQKQKNRKHLYQSSGTTSIETTGLVLNLDASNLDNAGNSADSSDTATTWTDGSGSGNNGTLTNFTLPTSATASGWDGANTRANPSVLKFDGVNDYVVLPDSVNSLVSGGTEITLAGWFKGTAIQSIIRLQSPGRDNNYIVLGWGTTNPNFIISTDGFTSGVNITNTSQDGNWHHVVGTWTKNTVNGFKVYLDGVVVNQRNSANVNLPILSGISFLGTYTTCCEFTNGSIANIRIYNTARTAEQIRQNYLAEASKFQGLDTTTEEATTIPSEEEATVEGEPEIKEAEIAISQAITPEGVLSAPIELDPTLNGEVQYNIDENTTQAVENAINFIGDEGKLNKEDIEFAEDLLGDEVNAISLTKEETKEGETGEAEEEGKKEDGEFQFDPTCRDNFIILYESLPEEEPSREELLAFGEKVVFEMEEGSLKDCVPQFMKKIIDRVREEGDKGFISFAVRFIFHVKGLIGMGEGASIDGSGVCKEIKKGFQPFLDCQEKLGEFCTAPPCFPETIRTILEEDCPDFLLKFPQDKCQKGLRPCEIVNYFDLRVKAQSSPEEEIGECINFTPPLEPNYCNQCESDDDCIGPKKGDRIPGAPCELTPIACVSIPDDVGDLHKICHFDGNPKDPFTCKELLIDFTDSCFGPIPPANCKVAVLPEGNIVSTGFGEDRFDKRCCIQKGLGFNITFKDTSLSGFRDLLETCILEKICSDIEANFKAGDYGGTVLPEDGSNIVNACKAEVGIQGEISPTTPTSECDVEPCPE